MEGVALGVLSAVYFARGSSFTPLAAQECDLPFDSRGFWGILTVASLDSGDLGSPGRGGALPVWVLAPRRGMEERPTWGPGSWWAQLH